MHAVRDPLPMIFLIKLKVDNCTLKTQKKAKIRSIRMNKRIYSPDKCEFFSTVKDKPQIAWTLFWSLVKYV